MTLGGSLGDWSSSRSSSFDVELSISWYYKLGDHDALVYALSGFSLGQDWPQDAADDVRRRIRSVESTVKFRREAGLFVLDTERWILNSQRPRQSYTLVDVA